MSVAVTAVVGLQWGDEGKGKLVDALAARADYVVRYASGSNAGHTVIVNGRRFVFHIIPSGILHERTTCLVCRGVAFDPESFFSELKSLQEAGIAYENRLWISRRAHLVLPLHKLEDEALDRLLGIGTTKRGVGPCYADRAYRLGVRVIDLYCPTTLRQRIRTLLEVKSPLLRKAQIEPPSFDDLFSWCEDVARRLQRFVADTAGILQKALSSGAEILLEGAQGVMLDIDHGTYPYVTSCHPATDGISSGCGINIVPQRVIGVLKCYTTRVGAGPFPTEEKGDIGETLRRRGGEFGATTSRPRRCGWLDLPALKYACRIAAPTHLFVTKLDVLAELEKIKVCSAYRIGADVLTEFPADISVLEKVEPLFREFCGWGDVKGVEAFSRLPSQALEFLAFIEEELGVEVGGVSVGSERMELLERQT
ncbi:MAG: adenylosuccinate synthase [Planctomycetota bacterium]|nr:MAG: adenylosuccinate synthase [Planctomycetota bacterium]